MLSARAAVEKKKKPTNSLGHVMGSIRRAFGVKMICAKDQVESSFDRITRLPMPTGMVSVEFAF